MNTINNHNCVHKNTTTNISRLDQSAGLSAQPRQNNIYRNTDVYTHSSHLYREIYTTGIDSLPDMTTNIQNNKGLLQIDTENAIQYKTIMERGFVYDKVWYVFDPDTNSFVHGQHPREIYYTEGRPVRFAYHAVAGKYINWMPIDATGKPYQQSSKTTKNLQDKNKKQISAPIAILKKGESILCKGNKSKIIKYGDISYQKTKTDYGYVYNPILTHGDIVPADYPAQYVQGIADRDKYYPISTTGEIIESENP